MPFVSSVHTARFCQYPVNIPQYVLTAILQRMAVEWIQLQSSFVSCPVGRVHTHTFGSLKVNAAEVGVAHLDICEHRHLNLGVHQASFQADQNDLRKQVVTFSIFLLLSFGLSNVERAM